MSVIKLRHRFARQAYASLRSLLRPLAHRRAESQLRALRREYPRGSFESIACGSNQLVLSVATEAYVEFTLNWVESLRRVGVSNYIVLALDPAADKKLRAAGIKCVAHHSASSTAFASHGSADFNAITAFKTLFVYLALDAGLDVFMSDGDTAWLSDPHAAFEQFSDFQIQVDNYRAKALSDDVLNDLEVNTGLYLVRSNERTIGFFRELITLQCLYPRYNDQRCFNHLLRRWKKRIALLRDFPENRSASQITVRLLPPALFPNGSVYFNPLESPEQTPLIVHANWIYGKDRKIEMMRQHGLWFLGGASGND